jgi:hypothetical protein
MSFLLHSFSYFNEDDRSRFLLRYRNILFFSPHIIPDRLSEYIAEVLEFGTYDLLNLLDLTVGIYL